MDIEANAPTPYDGPPPCPSVIRMSTFNSQIPPPSPSSSSPICISIFVSWRHVSESPSFHMIFDLFVLSVPRPNYRIPFPSISQRPFRHAQVQPPLTNHQMPSYDRTPSELKALNEQSEDAPARLRKRYLSTVHESTASSTYIQFISVVRFAEGLEPPLSPSLREGKKKQRLSMTLDLPPSRKFPIKKVWHRCQSA